MGEIFNSETDFSKLLQKENYIIDNGFSRTNYKAYFEEAKVSGIPIKLHEDEKKILIERGLIRIAEDGSIKTFIDNDFLDENDEDDDFIDEGRAYGKNNYYIGVFDESAHNFTEDPYFKVSWRSDFPNGCTARVKFDGSYFVIHNGVSAYFSSKAVKDLNDIIRNTYKNETVQIIMKNTFTDEEKIIETPKIVWDNLFIEFIKTYEGHLKGEDYIREFTRLKFMYPPIDFSKVQFPENEKFTKIRWGKD